MSFQHPKQKASSFCSFSLRWVLLLASVLVNFTTFFKLDLQSKAECDLLCETCFLYRLSSNIVLGSSWVTIPQIGHSHSALLPRLVRLIEQAMQGLWEHRSRRICSVGWEHMLQMGSSSVYIAVKILLIITHLNNTTLIAHGSGFQYCQLRG